MKQIKLFSLAAMLLLLVAACSNGNTLEPVPTSPTDVTFTEAELAMLYQMRGNTRTVDLSQATRFAHDVIGFLDAEIATRSGNPRTIHSVTAMTFGKDKPASTRTSEGKPFEFPDTLAYVFNYGDDEGYAIVSADKRIDAPILAYCAGGSFSEENLERDNPAMYYELLDVKNYAVECIARYEERVREVTNSVLQKLDLGNTDIGTRNSNNDHYYLYIVPPPPNWPDGTPTYSTNVLGSGIWSITEQIEPLLPVEWHQQMPFKAFVSYNNTIHDAPAGCVAIALSQLMTYWGYPETVDDYFIDWDVLRNHTVEPDVYPNVEGKDTIVTLPSSPFYFNAALLVSLINDNIGAVYLDEGTAAQDGAAIDYLENLEYNIGDGLESYNYNEVKNSLINTRPVYVSGSNGSEIIVNGNVAMAGHTWLIDGYLNRQKTATILVEVRRISDDSIVCIYQTPETVVTNSEYFHHNWGRKMIEPDGDIVNNNTYIIAGSFNMADSNRLPTNTRTESISLNYQYNKQMCTQITPY